MASSSDSIIEDVLGFVLIFCLWFCWFYLLLFGTYLASFSSPFVKLQFYFISFNIL